MKAYHGQQVIKDKYLYRVRLHRYADNLVRGETGQNGKGCAVWCTLNKYEHKAYESELGIPSAIALLEDGLFEYMPLDLAMEWPERFLAAIQPGADLSMVISRFLVWLLTDSSHGVIKFAKSEKSKNSIQVVSDLHQRRINGETISDIKVPAASDAYAADAAAADAADAYAAAAAYAASAAAAAAYAYAAASAASAASAAAAAYAADAADAADAYAAARTEARIKQADKLVELLASAPVAKKRKQ